VRLIRIDDLQVAPYNPRTITSEARDGLNHSINLFGLVQPIVVNKRSGFTIIGGHQRLEALKDRGAQEAQVLVVDLDEKDERALNLTLNNPHVEGKFTDALQQILAELQAQDPALISELNLDMLQTDLIGPVVREGKTDPDWIPEPPAAAKTKRGDIWILGKHRLMCGDSSSRQDLDRLLDGAKIHLVNTDPPYNVKVEPRSNNAIAAGNSSFEMTHHRRFDLARHPEKAKGATHQMRAKDRPLMNDFVKPADFDKMLRAWFGNMSHALIPGRGFYIWGGYANCANYPAALVESELYFSQMIVWIKQHPVLTSKDFMGNHEWAFFGWKQDAENLVLAPDGFERDHRYAFYGWKEGAAHYFDPVTFNATDVWEVKKINPQSMVHLTEKPVELAVRALQYSSRPAENVLDLFGGSGSTLIGCEQTDRNAYLMEMDQAYCDVIVERWEKFAGKSAALV